MYQAKSSIFEKINDISQLEEPVNLETIDGILPNRKLQIIYYNLLWVVDSKVPKIDGIKSLLILLDYVYNKFDDIRKISPHLLARKNESFYLIIAQIFNTYIDKKDKDSLKNLEQYFYDNDFFTSFLIMLNKKNNSVFKEKFSFFSKVSINIYLIIL
jgi:hypothetical protein